MATYTNDKLAAHPAFGRNVELLRSYGVRFVSSADAEFPWKELREVAEELHTRLS